MDFHRKSGINVVYCPNKACIASGDHKLGLQRPLLELPVDPNHVRLVCPFCDVNVIQCDSCSALIVDGGNADATSKFQGCRKCGFPNITDEKLRVQVLGLPRNQPLPYQVARVIQRAINPELYRAYKLQELDSIESANTDTTAETIIVSSLTAHHGRGLAENSPGESHIFHGISDDHSANTTGKSKKRPREGKDDGAKDDSDYESDACIPKAKKRISTLGSLDNADIPKFAAYSREESKSGALAFGKWKRHLSVPVSSMVQCLRSQVRVLDVKMCADHDARTWQSMQPEEGAKQFLPVHAKILRCLFHQHSPTPFDTHPSQFGSENGVDIEGNDRTSKVDSVFFQRIERFLDARLGLLALKKDMKKTTESIPAFWSRDEQADMSAIARSGIPENAARTILAVFGTKNRRIHSLARNAGREHLDLLQSVAEEYKRRAVLLFSLLDSGASPAPVDPLANGDSGTLVRKFPSELPQRGPDIENSEHLVSRLSLDLANTIEQTKMCLLILSNLHRSVAATIL